jgi:hypothetical protein
MCDPRRRPPGLTIDGLLLVSSAPYVLLLLLSLTQWVRAEYLAVCLVLLFLARLVSWALPWAEEARTWTIIVADALRAIAPAVRAGAPGAIAPGCLCRAAMPCAGAIAPGCLCRAAMPCAGTIAPGGLGRAAMPCAVAARMAAAPSTPAVSELLWPSRQAPPMELLWPSRQAPPTELSAPEPLGRRVLERLQDGGVLGLVQGGELFELLGLDARNRPHLEEDLLKPLCANLVTLALDTLRGGGAGPAPTPAPAPAPARRRRPRRAGPNEHPKGGGHRAGAGARVRPPTHACVDIAADGPGAADRPGSIPFPMKFSELPEP